MRQKKKGFFVCFLLFLALFFAVLSWKLEYWEYTVLSGKCRQICLIADINKQSIQTLAINNNVICRSLSEVTHGADVFFYSSFSDNSYQEWTMDFLKWFFFIYWNDHIILNDINLNYSDSYLKVKSAASPRINSTWSWCICLWLNLLH